jgi:hypothetical protein
MANVIYPKYKEALITGDSNISLSSGDVKACLVDTGTYTYNAAHDFLNDLSGIVATSGNLAGKSVTNGVFDCDNVTFASVSGSSAEAIVIYIDTGVSSTSRLVAYIDTGVTNLPVTPNGGDINIIVNASGLFAL